MDFHSKKRLTSEFRKFDKLRQLKKSIKIAKSNLNSRESICRNGDALHRRVLEVQGLNRRPNARLVGDAYDSSQLRVVSYDTDC